METKEPCHREVRDGSAPLVSFSNSVAFTCPSLRLLSLTQHAGGGLWRSRARIRPLCVSLRRSVSVPGALGAVPGGGRATGGRPGCSSARRCRPRVGHALYQRGATEDEGILREIVQRCRISRGGQSMGVA